VKILFQTFNRKATKRRKEILKNKMPLLSLNSELNAAI
jgi:hypothetical protein